MIENFLQYGQWVILFLSIWSLYLVSSVKHETRLNGYILTGVSRFSGAAVSSGFVGRKPTACFPQSNSHSR